MSRRPGLLSCLCALSLSLAGCGDGSDATTTTSGTDAATDPATGGTADSSSGAATETSTSEAPTTSTTTTTTTMTTGELKLGDIIVNVTYDGAQVGTLSLAAVTSFPPQGPPQASVIEMAPVFPFTGTLKGLEPKDYYVAAVLDIGNNNPQSPGPEDLVAFTPMPVTIVGDDMPMIDLVLMDK